MEFIIVKLVKVINIMAKHVTTKGRIKRKGGKPSQHKFKIEEAFG